jgi:hypothetical protein
MARPAENLRNSSHCPVVTAPAPRAKDGLHGALHRDFCARRVHASVSSGQMHRIVRVSRTLKLKCSFGALLVLGTVPFQAFCSDDERITCTADARVSVLVSVFDVGGFAVTDAEVSYAANGARFQTWDNLLHGLYSCGFETAGNFEVRAAHGTASKAIFARVERDECHVITQAVSIAIGEPE